MQKINYQDLHRVYKREFSQQETPQPVVEKTVVKQINQPVVITQQEIQFIDEPTRDLVGTLAGYAVGWSLSNWLGSRKQSKGDANQIWN